MTLEKRILELLTKHGTWLTAQEIHKRLRANLSSVGSLLLKLSQKPDGLLIRELNHGPRGGYGYRLRATLTPTLKSFWLDKQLGSRVQVMYFDKKSNCYRVRVEKWGRLRLWAAAEEFGRGRRYEPATTRYDLIGAD